MDDDRTTWKVHAQATIDEIAQNIELDEVRGLLYAETGVDHRFNTYTEEFSDAESFRNCLLAIAENEWINHVPYEGGEPVFQPSVDGMVDSLLEDHKVEEFFEQFAIPTGTEEIFSARDLTQAKAGMVIRVDIEEINDELIRYLATHPEMMQTIDRRKFEELVAELFKDKGYDVELTPATRDGGKDIRAYQRTDLGTLLTYVECKRPDPGKKVSVEVVRGLFGVVEAEKATRGIIATTSTFTKDACSFQKTIQYRMQLADGDILAEWLRAHRANG